MCVYTFVCVYPGDEMACEVDAQDSQKGRHWGRGEGGGSGISPAPVAAAYVQVGIDQDPS